jgi:ABC-type bacteriocin/lantibiotic exporter with double-glycine peptidase domain
MAPKKLELFVLGVVGQEPVLFDFTIEENIRMGRSDCTNEDIEKVNSSLLLPHKYS